MSPKKKMTSLDELKQLQIGPKDDYLEKLLAKSKKAAPSKNVPEQEPPQPTDEEELFSTAMQGVQKMDGATAGRQVSPRPTRNAPTSLSANDTPGSMDDVMRSVDFELEFTEEYMHGYVRDLDSKIFQQLKAGALSCQAHLDMHGLNSEQAFDNLLFFIRESYLQNRRCLLIVTGRGKNSPGGRSVLKEEIQSWLTRDPLHRIVLAFCTAQPKDGGAGALYVLLRKQKKQQGKVKWDKMMNWDD